MDNQSSQKNSGGGCLNKLEDWIDYIEESLPVRKKEKLDLLLRFSMDDQMVVDNLTRLRRLVKHSDSAKNIDVELNSKLFMMELKNAIMDKITSKANRKSVDSSGPKNLSERHQDVVFSQGTSDKLEID